MHRARPTRVVRPLASLALHPLACHARCTVLPSCFHSPPINDPWSLPTWSFTVLFHKLHGVAASRRLLGTPWCSLTRGVPPISRRTSHRQVYAVGLLLPLLTGSAWVWLGDYDHPAFVWILHVQAQHAVVRPCQGILDVAWVPSHATRPRRCSGKKKKKNSWSHRARAAGGYGYS
jgi:hypothetical protein